MCFNDLSCNTASLFTRNRVIAPLLFCFSNWDSYTEITNIILFLLQFLSSGSVVKFAFLKIVSAQMVTLALKAFWGQLLIGMHHCICCDEFPSPSAGQIVTMWGEASLHSLQNRPWSTFCFLDNGSAQITEWCLQQSLSLSSHCFHDNDHDMPGASKRGRETNPVFFTAPKCLLSHLQLFHHRQT